VLVTRPIGGCGGGKASVVPRRLIWLMLLLVAVAALPMLMEKQQIVVPKLVGTLQTWAALAPQLFAQVPSERHCL
jgi:hypothetical protein